MHPYPDDEVLRRAAELETRRRIAHRRARCRTAAKASFVAGASGLVFLSIHGIRPASVAMPVLLAALSLLLAAASAGLFAHVATLYLETPDQDPGDEGEGPGGGGGSEHPPEPPGGGDLRIDWDRFEHDFRAYCERVTTPF